MEINCFSLGDFETNCYLVSRSENASKCLIIDPGFGVEPLVDWLKEKSLAPQRILLTHGHCDHIAGIPRLQDEFGPIPVVICHADEKMLVDCRENLSMMLGKPFTLPPADQALQAGDEVQMDGFALKVMATPGHSPGSISLYSEKEKVVFTGDALFAGSIGRHDFPGGDLNTLLERIRAELFILPGETRVYPGHGPITSIQKEKDTNPFFR